MHFLGIVFLFRYHYLLACCGVEGNHPKPIFLESEGLEVVTRCGYVCSRDGYVILFMGGGGGGEGVSNMDV